jgi:15-cis-phytoene synthase
MSVLYAFCREVDDVADEDAVPVEERRRRLAEWREDVRRACGPGEPRMAVNRELAPVIARYGLSCEHFDELIRGVEMDLDRTRYATYAELDEYCYRVASVVGLLSIEIFGYREAGCREYAVALGKALQLTNILRDVGNDAGRGRVYLPAEALREEGVTVEEVLRGEYSGRFRRAALAVAGRARSFYREAERHLPPSDRRAMIAAELMGAVYWRLLRKMEAGGFRVLGGPPVRVGRGMKLLLALRTWVRLSVGLPGVRYGGA